MHKPFQWSPESEPAGVASLKRHLAGDAQFGRPGPGNRQEDVSDIDPDAVYPEALSSAAQHLPFAAGEVQVALSRLEAADLVKNYQVSRR